MADKAGKIMDEWAELAKWTNPCGVPSGLCEGVLKHFHGSHQCVFSPQSLLFLLLMSLLSSSLAAPPSPDPPIDMKFSSCRFSRCIIALVSKKTLGQGSGGRDKYRKEPIRRG